MASLSSWKEETAAHAALIRFGWLALVSIGTFFAVADCGGKDYLDECGHSGDWTGRTKLDSH